MIEIAVLLLSWPAAGADDSMQSQPFDLSTLGNCTAISGVFQHVGLIIIQLQQWQQQQ